MTAFDPIRYINEPRWQESRLGLERIRELLERMDRPQDRLRFVHVAGTNGKGSTCAYIESALRCAGYKTGLFTSPYVLCFEERIRVGGENIGSDDLRDVTLFVREHAEAMAAQTGEHPTEFELMCAVAFEHFARSGCDIVVCEVGMGGRLDSTNAIERPEACVITRIGLDHTAFLGTTLGQVATEKAGIIKDGAPVISWPQEDAEAREAVLNAARQHGATVCMPDFGQLEVSPVEGTVRPFTYKGTAFRTRLLGSYQPYNAALALEALEALRVRGWDISDASMREGVEQASWPGRFEIVSPGPPPLIVDGGHNPQGAAVLAESLRDVFGARRIVFVMGVLADKNYRSMIRAVAPLACAFICASPPNPRALPAEELARAVREELLGQLGAVRADLHSKTGGNGVLAEEPFGQSDGNDILVEQAPDYARALQRAREIANAETPICAFGSLYALSDIYATTSVF